MMIMVMVVMLMMILMKITVRMKFQQKFTCNYGSTGHLDWLLGTLHVPKSAA